MNRRRRFVAKRKRTVTRKLADMMSAAHLNTEERIVFLNIYRWPSELRTPEHALLVMRVVPMNAALRYPYLRHYKGV